MVIKLTKPKRNERSTFRLESHNYRFEAQVKVDKAKSARVGKQEQSKENTSHASRDESKGNALAKSNEKYAEYREFVSPSRPGCAHKRGRTPITRGTQRRAKQTCREDAEAQ